MARGRNWEKYIDEEGNFELPNYLYHVINDLMKNALDYGTMVSSDKAKLRSYKEQVKKTFKSRWMEVASMLEAFGMVEPCICDEGEFCKICGGSRYKLSPWLSPDEMKEISIVASSGSDVEEVKNKLAQGLLKAMKESRDL